MGRIRNISINSGVRGLTQNSIYEYETEQAIEDIQKYQLSAVKFKYEIVVENGTYISNNLLYDNNKMEFYLLNLNHKDGGSKAKFLKNVLGYKQGDGIILYNNIKKALIDQVPVKISPTPSGVKQEYKIKLKAKDGSIKTARVVVIFQKDKGKTVYRIITMYPDKKEK